VVALPRLESSLAVSLAAFGGMVFLQAMFGYEHPAAAVAAATTKVRPRGDEQLYCCRQCDRLN
jgi:hypothetical protein